MGGRGERPPPHSITTCQELEMRWWHVEKFIPARKTFICICINQMYLYLYCIWFVFVARAEDEMMACEKVLCQHVKLLFLLPRAIRAEDFWKQDVWQPLFPWFIWSIFCPTDVYFLKGKAIWEHGSTLKHQAKFLEQNWIHCATRDLLGLWYAPSHYNYRVSCIDSAVLSDCWDTVVLGWVKIKKDGKP